MSDQQAILVDIGRQLAEAREQRGLSVDQVAQEIHIRQAFLQAMEAGDFDALPDDVVARGFLRSYATFLGLDPEPLVAAFNRARPGLDHVPVTQKPATGPHVLEMDLGRPPRSLWGAALSWLLVVGLVLVAGYWLWLAGRLPLPLGPRNAGSTPTAAAQVALPTSPTPAPPTATPTSPATSAPSASPTVAPLLQATATPTATPTVTPTPTPTPTPTVTPTPSPTPVEEVVIQATLVDRTWLRVKVDGDTVLEGLLDPGRTFTWRGKVVEIRTGNAGGMALVVNGEEIGLLGEPGEVQHWIYWAREGRLERVTPTPTPTPTPAP